MVGPSSSHTLGAVRLGSFAAKFAGSMLKSVRVTLYGSFAHTYKGHRTDVAIVGGLAGVGYDDENLANALSIARERGLDCEIVADPDPQYSANIAGFTIGFTDGSEHVIMGESIGGGRINVFSIDGMQVDISGEYHSLITMHRDVSGMAAHITAVMAENGVNIAYLRIYREERNKRAILVAETDQALDEKSIALVSALGGVERVFAIEPVR
jgi:L-serine dehydratase